MCVRGRVWWRMRHGGKGGVVEDEALWDRGVVEDERHMMGQGVWRLG